MTIKAIWNGEIVAESNDTIIVEGNHYFPPESIKKEYFNPSDTFTSCYVKGKARYFNLTVNGQINFDAAWHYPKPFEKAAHIKNYIAFWKGVQIEIL
ncbi:MAG: hypothetical protein CVU09_06960 [Bacteroidetes bacterium HGW-Bacteroidetes-4]|nr:MAG: hypothetical protein CVU09_06960 [Bacteroidetes bacterium HGW-Bacteroidetes-4]